MMAVSGELIAATQRRSHVVITGTGRAGTTFLVELLTNLGLETGFSAHNVAANINAIAHAGLEHDIRRDGAPYIVKSPGFCDYAEEVLSRSDIRIEHVFIPFRDLFEAAESRRQVQERNISLWSPFERIRSRKKRQRIKGGLWSTSDESRQEAVLLDMVYKLLLALSATQIPVTLLQYPRVVRDSHYLYEKLQPILRGVPYAEFKVVFERTVKPGLVHSFAVAEDQAVPV